MTSLFTYDKAAPFNLSEAGCEKRGAVLVHDLTYAGCNAPVKAYLVEPETRTDPAPAILFAHWLGEPATTNRTQFLEEAVGLAERGVVSLLVECMWAQPGWYRARIPEEDYQRSITQVTDLQRSMDFLLSQPNIDLARVAFVGHDFGAMYGTLMSGTEPRAKTCVLLAPTSKFTNWFLYAQQPADLPAYMEQLGPLDPTHFIGAINAPVFFQFAQVDEYVPPEDAAAFYAAALPRKQMTTYDTDHGMGAPQVQADRLVWLERELGLSR